MKLFKILVLVITLAICATDAYCEVNPIKWKYTEHTPKHEENMRILKKSIANFDAVGGEYAIFNTTTGEFVDHSAIFMDQYKPLVFGNVSRLFNFAVGLHSGAIKENEVFFYSNDNKIFDRISKEARDELFQSLGLRERNMITDILSAYIKLLKNEDNYLTQSQLDVLKKALFDCTTVFGKAKNAQVKGCNVSGIGSTQRQSRNHNDVMTSFIGEFEANGQHYAIMTILNKPMPKKSTYGFNSAGWNAVPLARDLITNMSSSQPSNNRDLLQKKISNFSAKGGAYMIVDAKTREPLEQEYIDFDKDTKFSTFGFVNLYLTTVGLNTGVLSEKDINFADMPIDFSSWFAFDDQKRVLKELDLSFDIHYLYSVADHLKAHLNVIENEKNLLNDTQLDALKKGLWHGIIIGNKQNIECYGWTSNTIKKDETDEVYTLFVGHFYANDREYGIAVVLDSPQGIKGEQETKWARVNVVPMLKDIIRNFVKD